MTAFYVESGESKEEIECITQKQAASIFLRGNAAGVLLMVSEVPFGKRRGECPKDARFWLTEELREEIDRKPVLRFIKTPDVPDAPDEMVEALGY